MGCLLLCLRACLVGCYPPCTLPVAVCLCSPCPLCAALLLCPLILLLCPSDCLLFLLFPLVPCRPLLLCLTACCAAVVSAACALLMCLAPCCLLSVFLLDALAGPCLFACPPPGAILLPVTLSCAPCYLLTACASCCLCLCLFDSLPPLLLPCGLLLCVLGCL